MLDIYEDLNASIEITDEFIEAISKLYTDEDEKCQLISLLEKKKNRDISNIQVKVDDSLWIDADDLPSDIIHEIEEKIENDAYYEGKEAKHFELQQKLGTYYSTILWRLEQLANGYGNTNPLTKEEIIELNNILGELK